VILDSIYQDIHAFYVLILKDVCFALLLIPVTFVKQVIILMVVFVNLAPILRIAMIASMEQYVRLAYQVLL
jgi:hypothetical protein